MSYQLRTLGTTRILDDGGSEVQLRSAKHTALFVFLNAERRRTHLRSELCEHLWTTEESRARHSLSQALYDIRSRIGPVIESTGSGGVRLVAAGAWYDVEAMLERLAREEFGAAAELYAGPYAVELDDVGTREFEYWLETERRRVRVAGRNAHRRRIGELEERGRWRELAEAARRFLKHAPGDVDAQRAFVRSLWLGGDRASALEYFASLEEREPGLAEEIRPLVDRIEGRTAGRVKEKPEPREAPLVGRGEELTALQRLSRDLDGPTVAHVRGEAGIGKTRLVREVERVLELDGFRVVRSRCREAEAEVPYAAAAEGLERWLGPEAEEVPRMQGPGPALARSALFPGSGDAPEVPADREAVSELRRRVFGEVAGLVRRLAEARRTLWVVEDVQWIDSTSAALVHHLVRRLRGSPLLVLCTSRPGADRDEGPRRHLERGDAAETVELRPLSDAEVRELVEAAADGPLPDGVEAWIADLSGGNPYFALELLRAYRERGGTGAPHGLDLRAGDLLDERLERVLRERLRGVSVEGLKVLEAVAVLGGRASWSLALSLARIEVSDPSWICRQLTGRGLLRAAEGEVEFAHDVLREVVYGDLGEIRRYSLHRAAAEALARSGEASRGTLAKHFDLGGDPARAFHYALAAARDAESRGAHREAAAHADRALTASRGEEPRHEVELRRLAARAYSSSGELGEAASRLEPLLSADGAGGTRAVRALLELAEIQIEGADEEAARRTLSLARRSVEADGPGRAGPSLGPDRLSTELRLEIEYGDRRSIDRAGDRLREAVRAEEAAGDGGGARAALALGAFLAFFESADEARRLIRNVRRAELPTHVAARATLLLGNVELRCANWDRSEYLFREGASSARRRSDAWRTGRFTNNLGCVHMEQGRWKEALALFDESAELYRPLPRHARDRLHLLINRADTALYRLRTREARSRFSSVVALAEEARTPKYEATARSSMGLLDLQRGKRRAAERQYRKVRDLVADRSVSQEGFKVDWLSAFAGEGRGAGTALRERAPGYRDTDVLSYLKLRWLAELGEEGGEPDPEIREELRARGLLWFEKFAERWARALRGNRLVA